MNVLLCHTNVTTVSTIKCFSDHPDNDAEENQKVNILDILLSILISKRFINDKNIIFLSIYA